MIAASKQYITRLTPNFNGWRKPSGLEGKCKSSNPMNKLFEEIHGFGWEEWLFHFIEDTDGYCYGFLQCFNRRKIKSKFINTVHLYTRLRNDGNKVNSKETHTFYVGRIDQLEVLGNEHNELIKNLVSNNEKMMKKSLSEAGIKNSDKLFDKIKSENKIFNVRFKKASARMMTSLGKKIKLPHGYYRFKLYDITTKNEFIKSLTNQ